MEHIGYKVFYKAQFDLCTKPGHSDVDILWELIYCIRFWLTKKYEKLNDPLPENYTFWSGWKNGSRLYSQSHAVILDSCCYRDESNHLYWAGKIQEPPASSIGFAPREWLTEIGFQQETSGMAKVSLVTAYLDRPGYIGQCQPRPTFNTPGIIHHLRRSNHVNCTVSGHLLTPSPIRLEPGQFKEFWEVVSDPTRSVPVVYISPRWEDGRTVHLVDPVETARILDMNAIVYYADSMDFSNEMRQLCPDPDAFGCFSGAIRIYASLPRMDQAGDARRHRKLSVFQLRAMEFSPDADVYHVLRRALVQDVHFYENLFSVEECRRLKELSESQQHLNRSREALAATQSEIDAINDSLNHARLTLDAANDSREHLKHLLAEQRHLNEKLTQQMEEATEFHQLELDLKEQQHKEDVKQLRQEAQTAKKLADTYRESFEQSEQLRQALQKLRSAQPYPKEPEQVVDYFLLHFPERLDITERGRKSLKTCHTRADVLWEALAALVTQLYDMHMDENCTDLEAAFNAQCSNFEYKRGQSTATRSDKSLMRQYYDEYQGRIINVEPHLASNVNRESDDRFLRIYFGFDSPGGKIIISSCGKHLDTAATRRLH